MNAGCCRESLKIRRYRNIILAAFVLCGVAWSVVTPTFEAVDEADHLKYIVFLVQNHRLPVVNAPQPEVPLQGHQAPAYHVLMACVYRALFGTVEPAWLQMHPAWDPVPLVNRPVLAFLHGDEERFPFTGVARMVHVLRLVSVVIGLVALWGLHRALALLFPAPSSVPLIALGWAAFLPGFTCACARLGNDCLAAALGAAVLAQAVRMAREPRRSADWVLFGLLAGLGTLAKLTVRPVAFAAVVILAWFQRRDGRRLLAGLGLFGVCFVAVSGWWFLRNARLYGDPMAVSMTLKAAAFYHEPWSWDLVTARVQTAFMGYWGRFGHHTLVMSQWVYRAAYLVTLLWVVGAVRQTWIRWPDWPGTTRTGLWVLLAAAVANLGALIRFALYKTSSEGRYLLPTLVAHALIVGLAMAGLGAAFARRPLQNARRLCLLSAGLGLVCLVGSRPLLPGVDWLVGLWVHWRPRQMSLEFYLEQGRLLYRFWVGGLLSCAAVAAGLWAWQARRARAIGTDGLSQFWRERRFELALGWAGIMAGLNLVCLMTYVLPACR